MIILGMNYKMGKKQSAEWKSRAEELIREGKNFKSVNETLFEELKSGIGGSTYRRFKADMFPEDARREALGAIKEKREGADKQPKTKLWNKTKQTEADTSVFADVLNEGLFAVIPCPHKGLKIEDVKQINMGGAIVGIVTYYTNINLNHPVIVFVTRTILLVIKVRKMCYLINEKIEEAKAKARDVLPGQGSVGSMQK